MSYATLYNLSFFQKMLLMISDTALKGIFSNWNEVIKGDEWWHVQIWDINNARDVGISPHARDSRFCYIVKNFSYMWEKIRSHFNGPSIHHMQLRVHEHQFLLFVFNFKIMSITCKLLQHAIANYSFSFWCLINTHSNGSDV